MSVLKEDTLPGLVTPTGTDQAYETPVLGVLVAVTVVLCPVHTVGLLTETVGVGLTVTTPVAEAVQPLELVTVTV